MTVYWRLDANGKCSGEDRDAQSDLIMERWREFVSQLRKEVGDEHVSTAMFSDDTGLTEL